jgi:hypothetical protein
MPAEAGIQYVAWTPAFVGGDDPKCLNMIG